MTLCPVCHACRPAKPVLLMLCSWGWCRLRPQLVCLQPAQVQFPQVPRWTQPALKVSCMPAAERAGLAGWLATTAMCLLAFLCFPAAAAAAASTRFVVDSARGKRQSLIPTCCSACLACRAGQRRCECRRHSWTYHCCAGSGRCGGRLCRAPPPPPRLPRLCCGADPFCLRRAVCWRLWGCGEPVWWLRGWQSCH